MADIRENGILQPVELTSTFGVWREETNSAIEILNSANSVNSSNTIVYRDISGGFEGNRVDITNLVLGSSSTSINPNVTGTINLGSDTDRWNIVHIGGSSTSELSMDQGTRFAVPIVTTVSRDASPIQGNTGSVVFNTTTARFEGHNGSAFASLGATIDGDDDTTIIAETGNGVDNDILQFFAGSILDTTLELGESGIIAKKVVGFSSNSQLRTPAGITSSRQISNQNVSRGTLTLDQTGAGTGDNVYVLQTTGGDSWQEGTTVNVGDLIEINDASAYHYFRVILLENSNNNLVLKFVEKRSLLTYEVEAIAPAAPTLSGFTSVFRIRNFIGDIRYNSDIDKQYIEHVSSLDSVSRGENWSPIGGSDITRLENDSPNLVDQSYTFTFSTPAAANLQAIGAANLDVFLNGVKLQDGTDYTILGNVVTVLGSTLNADDLMQINVYGIFNVANHYTISEWTTGNITVGPLNITGSISVDGGVVHTSLRELKTNIEDIQNPIDRIMKLRGVEFDWKKNGNHELGFIKEEVETAEERLVEGRGVKYGNITALLVEAIKEQQKEIEELKKEVKNGSI